MAENPTSSSTIYTTLGAPSGALGGSNGVQSGTESRISTLIVPLNGSLIPRPSVRRLMHPAGGTSVPCDCWAGHHPAEVTSAEVRSCYCLPAGCRSSTGRTGRPMTEVPTGQGPLAAGRPLRTPRAAAVAGIVFSVLLISALVLLRLSVPAHPGVAGAWLTDPGRRAAVAIALNLVPFAGIAFLWFIGVLRDRIGEREDRFFATVFLGSGLLFVGMLFVAAAVADGLIAAASRPSGPLWADTLALGRDVSAILVNVYSMRMAAVFTLTTVTIARRTQIVSRWLTVAGIVAAVVLLVGVGISAWVELLFPAWILALSIDILAAGLRVSTGGTGTVPQGLIARAVLEAAQRARAKCSYDVVRN